MRTPEKFEKLRFLQEFCRRPRTVGAIAPSSRFAADEIVSRMELENASVVVEYGPGTGAFTVEILKRLNPDALFFVIESSASMCNAFRNKFPGVMAFQDSAANVGKLMGKLGVEEADCIVSALPWTCFSDGLQTGILDASVNALRKGGRFATIAYLSGMLFPSGWRFRRKLLGRFEAVGRSRTTWKNLPPAFIYHCTK